MKLTLIELIEIGLLIPHQIQLTLGDVVPRCLLEQESNIITDKAKSRLQNCISAVVTRYRGKVFRWDLVNDAIDDYASTRLLCSRDGAALPLDNLYLRKPVYLQMQEELARTLTYDIYNFLSPHSRTNKYLGVSNDPTSGNIRSLGVFNVTVIVGGVQTTNIGFVDYKCFYLHEG
ncbi:unnamed protein product [Adineta ricciae]|uniref:GH10 domain-containing protein n=1 Tax=Adineta ricciae TaxID=249248 RepID=A0A815XNT1_ADIRI|nr:unnamed protein product [Adineta ricciae]